MAALLVNKKPYIMSPLATVHGIAPSLNGYMAVRVIEGSIDGVGLYDFVVNGVTSLLCVLYSRNANEHCTFDRLELRIQVPWTN